MSAESGCHGLSKGDTDRNCQTDQYFGLRLKLGHWWDRLGVLVPRVEQGEPQPETASRAAMGGSAQQEGWGADGSVVPDGPMMAGPEQGQTPSAKPCTQQGRLVAIPKYLSRPLALLPPRHRTTIKQSQINVFLHLALCIGRKYSSSIDMCKRGLSQ